MATPAAVLSILVEANTGAANASLAKTDAALRGTTTAATGATTSTSRAGGALRKLGSAAKWGGAALAVGFVVEAKKAVSTTQDLTKTTIGLHKNLGLTNKQASEWAGVLKARGADSQKAGMAFKTLATQISAAGHGSATAIPTFKELGFSQADIHRAMTDTQFAIKGVADGLNNLPAGADKATISSKLFGRGWQTVAPILRDGSSAMQDQLDTVEKYGGVLQGKTLDQQEKLLANIRENKIAWQGFQVTLATAVTPALNAASDQFQHISAIMANPKLTDDQKFKKISGIIKNDFQDITDFLTGKVLPNVLSAAGEAAPKVAGALVDGFLNAPVLGKLALGGWFVSKLGGWNMISALGGRIGTKMGSGMAASTVAGGAGAEGAAVGTVALTAQSVLLSAAAGAALGLALDKVFPQGIIPKFDPNKAPHTPREWQNIITYGVDHAKISKDVGPQTHGAGQPALRPSSSVPGPAAGPDSTRAQDIAAHAHSLFQAAIDDVHNLISASDVAGKRIPAVISALSKKYGSIAAAASHMSQSQAHSFLSLAVSAHLPMPVLKKLTTAFAESGRLSGADMKDLSDITGLSMKQIRNAAQDGAQKYGNAQADIRSSNQKSSDSIHKFTGTIGSIKKWASDTVHAFSSASRASADGTNAIKNNANSALKGLGVGKSIDFSTFTLQGTPGAHQRGGRIVPGTGSGDTVPAMLEPGEFVLNREAVKGIGQARLESLNKAIPRFAKGGPVIQQALGPYTIPPIQYDPNHAGGNSHVHADFFTIAQALAYGHKMQGMGWSIGEYTPSPSNPFHFGPITVQHQSPGHYDGTAFDANTAQGETRAQVAAVAKLFNSGVAGGAIGAAVQKIKRQIIRGPKGALGGAAQMGLDHVWQAANAFLAKQAPKMNTTSADFIPGSGDVVKAAGSIIQKAGGAKTTAAAILGNAWQESTWNPHAGSLPSGPGGLWGFTSGDKGPSALAAYANAHNGSIFDPAIQTNFMLTTARGMLGSLNNESLSAATADFMTNWEAPLVATENLPRRLQGAKMALNQLQRGGFIPQFANGGVVPGPIGRPVPAIVHGGETITPAGGESTVNVDVHHHYAPGMEWLADFVDSRVDVSHGEYAGLATQEARMR